jgi:TonB family protein
MTEVWTTWEGEVINGAFPLRHFLNGSDHSGVFLTECNAQGFLDAAIKIIAADPSFTETQLSNWMTAAARSHPHLIRLLDSGRSQLKGHPFLFVVMEYAEQSLSQILPHRALTVDEAREMLLPTLDALVFLHHKNLVHGQIKPTNLLVVNDQLKLSSDTLRPAGELTARVAKSSVYDPPEAKNGRISAAGDIWALGVTVVEALTQRAPVWSEGSDTPTLPESLPAVFAETVRRCLSRNPADRPTAVDLEAEMKAAAAPVVSLAPVSLAPVSLAPVSLAPVSNPPVSNPAVSIPQPAVGTDPGRAAPRDEPIKQRMLVPIATALVLILVVGWTFFRLLQRHSDSQQAASSDVPVSTQQAAPPTTDSQDSPPYHAWSPDVSAHSPTAKSAAASKPPTSPGVSRPSDRPTQQAADASPSVLHKEIPEVPRSARDTIRGHFSIAVRVTVDKSGNVVGETLEKPGPSKYFARLATEAARKWKFAPADTPDSRQCLVWFEFTRGGATGHAATARS